MVGTKTEFVPSYEPRLGSPSRIDPNPILYANTRLIGVSIDQTLENCGDIALSGKGQDCLKVKQLLLGLNINLIENRQCTKDASRRDLFGFEFMDVVCAPPHGGLIIKVSNKAGGRYIGMAFQVWQMRWSFALDLTKHAISAGQSGDGKCMITVLKLVGIRQKYFNRLIKALFSLCSRIMSHHGVPQIYRCKE